MRPTVRTALTRCLVAAALLAACGRAGADNPTSASVAPTHAFRTVIPSLSTLPAAETPCPTSTTTAGGVDVTLFLAPGGGCVRPDQLREFRCSDAVDPVVEAVGLRFLGGRFAMPVPGLPADAQLIGQSGGEDLFAVAGDRPTLYVRTSDGTVRRWLLLLNRVDAEPRVLVVGDSITVGSRGAIVHALPGWESSFYAKVGRTTEEGVTAAKTVHGRDDLDAVVVELGTNESTDQGFPDRIRQMLQVVGQGRLVVWVTVHRDLGIVPDLNTDISKAMATLPNGVVADWNAVVTPDDLVSDGVHPDDQGKALMASLLSGLLTRWNDAASGRGATACAAS
jgi:lysophospholipase L1-like esterase